VCECVITTSSFTSCVKSYDAKKWRHNGLATDDFTEP